MKTIQSIFTAVLAVVVLASCGGGSFKKAKSGLLYKIISDGKGAPLKPGSFIKVTGNGVWGDPRQASAEKGRRLVQEITEGIAKTIATWRRPVIEPASRRVKTVVGRRFRADNTGRERR